MTKKIQSRTFRISMQLILISEREDSNVIKRNNNGGKVDGSVNRNEKRGIISVLL